LKAPFFLMGSVKDRRDLTLRNADALLLVWVAHRLVDSRILPGRDAGTGALPSKDP
jgi:hypothetical protein